MTKKKYSDSFHKNLSKVIDYLKKYVVATIVEGEQEKGLNKYDIEAYVLKMLQPINQGLKADLDENVLQQLEYYLPSYISDLIKPIKINIKMNDESWQRQEVCQEIQFQEDIFKLEKIMKMSQDLINTQETCDINYVWNQLVKDLDMRKEVLVKTLVQKFLNKNIPVKQRVGKRSIQKNTRVGLYQNTIDIIGQILQRTVLIFKVPIIIYRFSLMAIWSRKVYLLFLHTRSQMKKKEGSFQSQEAWLEQYKKEQFQNFLDEWFFCDLLKPSYGQSDINNFKQVLLKFLIYQNLETSPQYSKDQSSSNYGKLQQVDKNQLQLHNFVKKNLIVDYVFWPQTNNTYNKIQQTMNQKKSRFMSSLQEKTLE